jgi:hypothetical protein
MHGHDLKHIKTKTAQLARSTKSPQNTAEDVHEVETRDRDRHSTTIADAIAKANHIAPEVQRTEIDKTIENGIQGLLNTVTIIKTQNLQPPATTNPPTAQTPTPTTP